LLLYDLAFPLSSPYAWAFGPILFKAGSPASSKTPIQAVPHLDDLKFLSPRPGDKLAVVRASNWQWDDRRDTAYILPQDVIEVEIVSESEVRVL